MTTDVLLKTPENIGLIWKHTSDDFRGITDGTKTVLYNQNGGTVLGSIEGMPSDVFAKQLKYAKWKEVCFQRDKKLKPIYKSFGLEPMFTGTNQWRGDFKTVLEIFKAHKGEELAKRVSDAIRDAYVPFPDGPDSDGIQLLDGVSEVTKPGRGMLEIVIQRPTKKVVRVFECTRDALQEMYKQAISNPYVLQYQIL